MTQQFKFGDPVRWSEDPRRFVYIEADPFYDGQAGWILSDDNAEYLASHSALEPIPHPDTVRLDWLLKQPNYTYPGNGYDDEGEPIEGVVLRQEYNMGDSARVIGHGKDARAAIDDAMQHEANHE